MSQEYPCVYYNNMKCVLYSEPDYTDWCVLGPCSHQTPSNGDHLRTMSDEELAEFLQSILNDQEAVWYRRFHDAFCKNCSLDICETKDCPHGEATAWWLRQPYKEDTP